MKKLISFILLLSAASVNAQNFEGTIKWSMKMEITDPAKKAKMEEQQKKMNDPANQAKMKEMQAKMNDPQMKAMMDANPQMKAQMEAMMKMQGGDMNAMMPKGLIIKIKGGNALTMMDGGPMPIDILYIKDKDQSYNLNRQNKTYTVINTSNSAKTAPSTPPKVTKTSETTKILNYTCTKYLVETSENNRTITQNIWTTTEIKDIDFKSMAKQRIGRGQNIYYEGMEGVPLRVVANTGEALMTMEVTEIKKESLSPDDFKIPSDFKEMQGYGTH